MILVLATVNVTRAASATISHRGAVPRSGMPEGIVERIRGGGHLRNGVNVSGAPDAAEDTARGRGFGSGCGSDGGGGGGGGGGLG